VAFGDVLRAVRGRQGLSLKAAAGHLGLSKPVLSRYETSDRKPDPQTMARLLGELGGTEAEVGAVDRGFILERSGEAMLMDLRANVEAGRRDLDLTFLGLHAYLMQSGNTGARIELTGTYIRWLAWWYRDREAHGWALRTLADLESFPACPAWGRIFRARASHLVEVERRPGEASELLAQAATFLRGQPAEAFLLRELAALQIAAGHGDDGTRHTLDQARATEPHDDSRETHSFCCDVVEAALDTRRGQLQCAFERAYERLPATGFLRFALAGSRAELLVKMGDRKRATRELDQLAEEAHSMHLPHFAAGLLRRRTRLA
jgi:transcriptional regulator with XRE-family HTH domain